MLVTKVAMQELLFQCKVLLEHDARINKLTLDESELNDSTTEDAFEEIRSTLELARKLIVKHVD
jgi:hypothetical protein